MTRGGGMKILKLKAWNVSSPLSLAVHCLKITDVCMDFEPYFKVHNLVSVYPKSIILGQMTNLNMIFHVVLSVCRLVKFETRPSPLMNFRTANTGAALYQLSYKANWELVTLWVHNITIDGKECNWINKIWYIWTAEKDIKAWLIIAVTQSHNLCSCQIKEIFRFFNFTTDSCNDQSCRHIVCFVNTPLDSDLSSGWYCPAFEQLRPGDYIAGKNTPSLRFKLLQWHWVAVLLEILGILVNWEYWLRYSCLTPHACLVSVFFIYRILKANHDRVKAKQEKKKMKQEKKKQ